MSSGNCLGRMLHMQQVRRTSGLGVIKMMTVEPQIVGHRQRSEPGGITRRVVRIDIGHGQTGIGQRTTRHLCMDLGNRLVRDFS